MKSNAKIAILAAALLLTTKATAQTAPDDIVLKNQPDMKWEKMLSDLGENSPVFTILRVDPKTEATTLMIKFPVAMHIPKHMHKKSETHIILKGAHIFGSNGKYYDVEQGGYFYLAGNQEHEAWVPAGSEAIIILEDGWKVDWLAGGPSAKDVGIGTPPQK